MQPAVETTELQSAPAGAAGVLRRPVAGDFLLRLRLRLGHWMERISHRVRHSKRLRPAALTPAASRPVDVPTASAPAIAGDGLFASQQPDGVRWRVSAWNRVTYEVRLCPDLLNPGNPCLMAAGAPPVTSSSRRLVVLDTRVHDLFGAQICGYFDAQGAHYGLCIIDAHERVKTMDSVFRVVASMDSFGVSRRREPVIAIGGGVLTDVVGLATSLYRRSTPYVRVPTTLIGMVDAGIGAKTGVNFQEHKNRLGAYHPSAATLIDPDFLRTLSLRHLRNGLAEMLKIALIKDAELFELLAAQGPRLVAERLQQHGSADHGIAAVQAIQLAIHGMLQELQPNLWEQQLERVVDFGHSFSPNIEMKALPELLHGEAVCIDMALSAVVAQRRGLVSTTDLQRIRALMAALRLPTWHPMCTPDLLADALADTTRHRDGHQSLPLPEGIGATRFVDDVSLAELGEALTILRDTDDGTAWRPLVEASSLPTTGPAR